MKRAYPLINDITTTPNAAPLFLTRGGSYPSRFAAIQMKAYPDLQPLIVKSPADKCIEAIKAIVMSKPHWKLVSVDPKRSAIEAVAITPLMRFRDDVIFEVRSEGNQSVIHMRSRSRLGRGDFGANAARIREAIAELKAALI